MAMQMACMMERHLVQLMENNLEQLMEIRMVLSLVHSMDR